MKLYLTAAVAAFGLVGLGAAAPASAQIEFAVFNPVGSDTGGVANFTEDSMGHLTGISSSTPTVFTFVLTPLTAFGNLTSTFNFSATETGATPEGPLTTATYDGSFDYYYSGPTVTQGSVTLRPGELLLGGSFSDATFAALTGSSGGSLADDSLNGTVTYTSAVPDLPVNSATGGSFTIGFINISPVVGIQNGFLRDFTAEGDGQFSSDLNGGGGGGGVPEPATWALMLSGLGGIGACLRRRPRIASAA